MRINSVQSYNSYNHYNKQQQNPINFKKFCGIDRFAVSEMTTVQLSYIENIVKNLKNFDMKIVQDSKTKNPYPVCMIKTADGVRLHLADYYRGQKDKIENWSEIGIVSFSSDNGFLGSTGTYFNIKNGPTYEPLGRQHIFRPNLSSLGCKTWKIENLLKEIYYIGEFDKLITSDAQADDIISRLETL